MREVEIYLNQVSFIDRKIQNTLSEVYQLKMLAYGVRSTNSDSEHVQSSSDKDQLGKTVAKIVDKEMKADALVDELFRTRSRIVEQMENIGDPTMYHILFGKYVANKRGVDIANEIGYSFSHYKKLADKAVKEFDNKYHAEIAAYFYAKRRNISQNEPK